MLKHISRLVALGFIIAVTTTPVMAQKVSEDEKALCLEAINDLTDGKPPAEAKKLCNEGMVEAAMEKAMSAQGG